MQLTKEERYIRRRLRQAKRQSRFFYYCRKYPINPKKIVFTTVEGTTGFSCNPKYIALELLRRRSDLDLVWLTNDMRKEFPAGIRKVKNTLRNRAYELSTAKIWVDNSRKQLECQKRPGQFYLQTWHASMAIKPTGLQRGASFSKIARLVTEHDSHMIDLLLTNSKWMEERLVPTGLLYHGNMLRTGSPRVDILLKDREIYRRRLTEKYGLQDKIQFVLYAPTFRGGSQGTRRSISAQNQFPQFSRIRKCFEERFGSEWVFLLRLHPQLTARNISANIENDITFPLIDISQEDDLFENLAGCAAVITDYSALAFDAAYIYLPVFLYVFDLHEYIEERGKLLWDVQELPFPCAVSDEELMHDIRSFNKGVYQRRLREMFDSVELFEDGKASQRAADVIENYLG